MIARKEWVYNLILYYEERFDKNGIEILKNDYQETFFDDDGIDFID